MKFLKPSKLKIGDTVAVISPSWGGPSVFPHIYENGLKILKEKFDLNIKEYPTVRMTPDELSKNPKLRAKDINNAFADEEVKAIFVTIGGDDAVRVLKYLNKNIIRRNPKIFMGYSDTSAYNMYLNTLGIVTFNGPAVMAGFSQMKNFPGYDEHVKNILFGKDKKHKYKVCEKWVADCPDWSKVENTGKVGRFNTTEGWHWLQGNTIIRGELFGGCIEIMAMMRGSQFWPKPNFFKNKIIFFETSEEKPSPEYIKYELRNWGIQGIFDQIKGIMIGRTRGYTLEETSKLEQYVIDVIAKEFGHPEIPIISNMDFGHTEPQIILPLGVKAEIDCKNKTVKLAEAAIK